MNSKDDRIQFVLLDGSTHELIVGEGKAEEALRAFRENEPPFDREWVMLDDGKRLVSRGAIAKAEASGPPWAGSF